MLALREDRPTPRARTNDSIPPSQAASARPNHETPRDATAVHNNRLCAARARLGHADDGLDQTGRAELPPRGACDRDAVDADAAPRPPAKAVLNSLKLYAAGDPGAPLRRSSVESRVKIYICNPGSFSTCRNEITVPLPSDGGRAVMRLAATACRRRGDLTLACGGSPHRPSGSAERNELAIMGRTMKEALLRT